MREEVLRAALWAALGEDLDEIWEGPEGEQPEFSLDHLAWEVRFLAECGLPKAKCAPKGRWRRVILAAAVLTVLLVGSAVAVLRNWNIGVLFSSTEHPFSVAAPDAEYADGSEQLRIELGDKRAAEAETALPDHRLGWLPESMVLTEELSRGNTVCRVYEETDQAGNYPANGMRIRFSYGRYTNFSALAEQTEYEEVQVNGDPGYLVWYVFDGVAQRDEMTLLWYDETAEMAFTLSCSCYGKDVEQTLFEIAGKVS